MASGSSPQSKGVTSAAQTPAPGQTPMHSFPCLYRSPHVPIRRLESSKSESSNYLHPLFSNLVAATQIAKSVVDWKFEHHGLGCATCYMPSRLDSGLVYLYLPGRTPMHYHAYSSRHMFPFEDSTLVGPSRLIICIRCIPIWQQQLKLQNQ